MADMSLDEALGLTGAEAADDSIHIDVNTRQVTVPESQQLFGVESDENVEVKHIVLDGRYNDGTDLSALTLRVNWRNANGGKGSYLVTNLDVTENSIAFDWVISRGVVAYKGTVYFIVCAFKVNSTGKKEQEWNSSLGQGTVLEGLEVTDEDIGGDDTVNRMLTILQQMNSVQAAAKNSADAAAASSKSASDTADSIKGSLDQIAENKAAVSQLKEATAALKDGKISKFYASSQGGTNLPDSDDGRIMDLMLYGKSEQKQYSGKNLLPRFETTTSASVTFTVDDNGVVAANGTATGFAQTAFDLPNETIVKLNGLVGTTLYLSGAKSAKKGRILLHLDYKDNSIQADSIYNYASNSNTSIDLKGTVKSGYAQISGESGSAFSGDVFYPMLSTSSDTAYEPYVGGIPSPNPEYPQEIKSVVKPVVKVMGKNLFDNTNKAIDSDGWTTTKIVYVPKGKYVYKRFVDASSNGQINTQLYALIDGLWKSISNSDITSFDNGNITFTSENWNMGWGTTGKVSFELKKAYYMRASNPSDEVHLMLVAGEVEPTAYEPYTESTATLPYTLNAIPVSSGGNVTIDGQQYIADYVDVEKGKLVRMLEYKKVVAAKVEGLTDAKRLYITTDDIWDRGTYTARSFPLMCSIGDGNLVTVSNNGWSGKSKCVLTGMPFATLTDAKTYFDSHDAYICYLISTPTETDLTADEIAAFKALVSYYPVTNASTTSDQLDGYTVFDYPISLANGWNYVKQQLGDTRDYLYGIDLMTAEAYVNSEYAAALAEIEV